VTQREETIEELGVPLPRRDPLLGGIAEPRIVESRKEIRVGEVMGDGPYDIPLDKSHIFFSGENHNACVR
jgi:hypothetical protein